MRNGSGTPPSTPCHRFVRAEPWGTALEVTAQRDPFFPSQSISAANVCPPATSSKPAASPVWAATPTPETGSAYAGVVHTRERSTDSAATIAVAEGAREEGEVGASGPNRNFLDCGMGVPFSPARELLTPEPLDAGACCDSGCRRCRAFRRRHSPSSIRLRRSSARR